VKEATAMKMVDVKEREAQTVIELVVEIEDGVTVEIVKHVAEAAKLHIKIRIKPAQGTAAKAATEVLEVLLMTKSLKF